MSLLYRLLCCLLGMLASGGGERELEIVVLRHQLAILRRGGRRPQYTTADQALLAAASRLLPPERWSCFAVSPQTLRRWHRALHEGGRRRRCRRPGRPPLAAETRELIKRLARENPRWDYVRIQGELLKLGISVSANTIATVLRSSGLGPAPRRIGPTWSEFLRAQAHSMLGGSPTSVADDDLGDDASEPSGSPQVGPDRQVGVGDHLSAADARRVRKFGRPAIVFARARTAAGRGGHNPRMSTTIEAPAEVELDEPARADEAERDKPWIVIVWNDPINLMSYVTLVFQKLFGYSRAKATRLMLQVHNEGKAVVSSGPREKAEYDVSRLHAQGLWATMRQD
jgi:ATP-dependent Clp protease adapter protein ClpS/transposase